MSGSSTASTPVTAHFMSADDTSQKWAALAKQNERLIEASHPLLAELRREHPEVDRSLPAAS
jgi:hypothetical protein